MGLRVVVGAGLILGAFAVIAVVAYFSNQELYLSVDELVSDSELYALTDGPGAGAQRRLQVRGTVDYDTVERANEGLEYRFVLQGKEGRLPVRYDGLVPDTFEQAEHVTVAGVVDEKGTFVADDLVVQCPSKYEAVPPTGSDLTIQGAVPEPTRP
jgi:cytochrome c-type biogenesis protein CcmE